MISIVQFGASTLLFERAQAIIRVLGPEATLIRGWSIYTWICANPCDDIGSMHYVSTSWGVSGLQLRTYGCLQPSGESAQHGTETCYFPQPAASDHQQVAQNKVSENSPQPLGKPGALFGRLTRGKHLASDGLLKISPKT